MNILHVSFECYPFAKVGGMADVVGALPKYQNELDSQASVVMPRFGLDWEKYGQPVHIFHGSFRMDWEEIHYDVVRYDHDFPVYAIAIPGKFDRPGIYSYHDDVGRSLAFQRAVLHWLRYDALVQRFDVIHCHDHHTGLIPFMLGYCMEFEPLRGTPTVFTIHNGAYQGAFSWDMYKLLPGFYSEYGGLIEWNNAINPLASAIKCAWHFNTVSNGYLQEMFGFAHGLEGLMQAEGHKASGILNGIDADVWDPRSDPFLDAHLKRSIDTFKRKNKEAFCKEVGLDPLKPLYLFIGRLAYEKGADMLPSIVGDFAAHFDDVQWAILGSGDEKIENQLRYLEHVYQDRIKAFIMYNEKLAHRLYASSDFPAHAVAC